MAVFNQNYADFLYNEVAEIFAEVGVEIRLDKPDLEKGANTIKRQMRKWIETHKEDELDDIRTIEKGKFKGREMPEPVYDYIRWAGKDGKKDSDKKLRSITGQKRKKKGLAKIASSIGKAAKDVLTKGALPIVAAGATVLTGGVAAPALAVVGGGLLDKAKKSIPKVKIPNIPDVQNMPLKGVEPYSQSNLQLGNIVENENPIIAFFKRLFGGN